MVEGDGESSCNALLRDSCSRFLICSLLASEAFGTGSASTLFQVEKKTLGEEESEGNMNPRCMTAGFGQLWLSFLPSPLFFCIHSSLAFQPFLFPFFFPQETHATIGVPLAWRWTGKLGRGAFCVHTTSSFVFVLRHLLMNNQWSLITAKLNPHGSVANVMACVRFSQIYRICTK